MLDAVQFVAFCCPSAHVHMQLHIALNHSCIPVVVDGQGSTSIQYIGTLPGLNLKQQRNLTHLSYCTHLIASQPNCYDVCDPLALRM